MSQKLSNQFNGLLMVASLCRSQIESLNYQDKLKLKKMLLKCLLGLAINANIKVTQLGLIREPMGHVNNKTS